MFTRLRYFAALAALSFTTVAVAEDATSSLKKGTPEIKSAGALAFGPDGVLFVADAPNTTVYALATGDAKGSDTKSLKVEKIDAAIGSLLGTTGADIIINDMKVNPASGNVYLSVMRGKGPDALPAIVKVGADNKVTELSLKDIPFASVKLTNAMNSQRYSAITSMAFLKGELYVAGFTKEEWESNLRAIPFPFSESATKGAGVKIYHAAHSKSESTAPIQTFMAYDIAGQTHLLASYTCTPLVKFPVADVKKLDKIQGTTVAELGNQNRPLDIIAYSKDGKDYALIANSSRGIMKVALAGVDKIEEITTPVRNGGTAGLKYDKIAELTGVTQLDKLSSDKAVILKKTGSETTLEAIPLP